MTKVENAALARHQLDQKFRVADVSPLEPRPRGGWIRAVRDALGMTSRQLAARLGVKQAAVTQLEGSERDDTIRLDSLKRAAEALDCTLVYALVPRDSLQEIVKRRASDLAASDLRAIDQTMRLEQQALPSDQVDERIDDYSDRLIASGRLWAND